MKIQELQDLITAGVTKLLPAEIIDRREVAAVCYHRVRAGKDRKIRCNAAVETFQPGPDYIRIEFSDAAAKTRRAAAAPAAIAPEITDTIIDERRLAANGRGGWAPKKAGLQISAPAERLLRALHEAASDGSRNFVGLKWFRDTILAKAGFNVDQAHQELRAAIENQWVRIAKLPNPNSAFPTSTLELNRSHPVVQRVLAAPAQRAPSPTFELVRLPPGFSLSEEVIKGRR